MYVQYLKRESALLIRMLKEGNRELLGNRGMGCINIGGRNKGGDRDNFILVWGGGCWEGVSYKEGGWEKGERCRM